MTFPFNSSDSATAGREGGQRVRPAPLALLLLLIAVPFDCSAYVDPNAGGMLFQLLAPLFAAIVGGWMFLRRSIINALRRFWAFITGQSGR